MASSVHREALGLQFLMNRPAGPQEVLRNYALGAKEEDQMFDVAIASASEITTAFEKVSVKRDISFADALQSISKYNIMIVAGGPPESVDEAISDSKNTEMLALIQAFASQVANSVHQKWLVSICTGAGFLATCGLLGGKTITSHWAYLDKLRSICEEHSKPATNVIKERYVDAGVNDSGVRLVTSGGVSCGIDCTLWLVSELAGAKGVDLANSISSVMDYEWRYPKPGGVSG